MFVNTLFRRVLFNTVLLLSFSILYIGLFHDVYTSKTIIISFAVHPFNICTRYPDIWFNFKLIYIPVAFLASLIYINTIYSSLFTKTKPKKTASSIPQSDLHLVIKNENIPITIPEAGLYQNFLITGTIGSGKTSSIMYPFTRQLIEYKYKNASSKLGMLILDVKGNYYSQVKKYVDYYRRSDDLVIIELGRPCKI